MTTQERVSELGRLEAFFRTAELPKTPIVMGGYMTLNNIGTFINTNMTRANSNISGSSSEPCILRLQQLEDYLLAISKP